MDNLKKEVEEMRATLKASQSWTNKWVDSVKELRAQSTSFHQDFLDLLKQHGDLKSNTQANACSVTTLEACLARQETRMANLVQRLEHAEVGVVGPRCLEPTNVLLAGWLSLWS